jgi:uncharacterized protein (TIGR02466 family)
MLSDRQTLHLFPTRVTTGRLIDAPDAAVAALVLARSRTTPSVARGERSGWQSGNDFLSWSADTARLGRLIADAVMAAHDEAAVAEISLFGWANLFTRGVHFSPHLHADAAWSGAYYLDAGDSSAERGGLLVLRDPRAGAGMVASASNRFDSGCAYEIVPRTGMLVVFPAWLMHWVTPYDSDRPRISVSFNAR